MRKAARAAHCLVLLALTATSVTACSDDDDADPDTGPASVAPSSTPPLPALREIPLTSTGRALANLDHRTGAWEQKLGKASDTGSLHIVVECVGGGGMVLTYTGSSSPAAGNTPVTCDGALKTFHDEAVAKGQVTVSLTPESTGQQWSALIVRGAEADD